MTTMCFLLLSMLSPCSIQSRDDSISDAAAKATQRRAHAICTKKSTGGFAYRKCIQELKHLADSATAGGPGGPGGPGGGGGTGRLNRPEAEDTASRRAPAAMRRPNILFITTDQQRRDTLGCYGVETGFVHGFSPNADRLARQGVRFTEAHASSPSCTPSRTSLLLGVHVPLHTVAENGLNQWPRRLVPFTDVLHEVGYSTALIGKSGFMPLPSSLDRSTGSWVLEMERKEPHERRTPGTAHTDFLETFLVNKSMAWISARQRETDTEQNKKPWFLHLSMLSPHGPNTLPTGRRDPWQADTADTAAAAATRGQGGRRGPLPPPPLPPFEDTGEARREKKKEQAGAEAGVEARLPTQTQALLFGGVGQGLRSPQLNKSGGGGGGGLSRREIDQHRRRYYAQAAYVDEQLGRILGFLDQSGLAASTLVVYTSDHGSMLHSHGVADKHTLHAEALRVPLIVRWPGVMGKEEDGAAEGHRPRTCDAVASTGVDLPASLLAAARAPIPRLYQGFDLFAPWTAPAAATAAATATAAAASQTPPLRAAAGAAAGAAPTGEEKGESAGGGGEMRVCAAAVDFFGLGLVTRRWKLWYYPETAELALFDRLRDPWETTNLATRYGSRKPSSSSSTTTTTTAYSSSALSTKLRRREGGRGGEAGDSSGANTAAAAAAATEEEYKEELRWVQGRLLEALLRWRARQHDLAQMWGQIARGPRYVGSFTTRAFQLLEGMGGLDAEADLQTDCAAADRGRRGAVDAPRG